jgi:glutamine synthetase
MATDTGLNLLEPTKTPESNTVFLVSLVAVLDAVYKHSSLLRCGIASASNDHRLGGNEAPPSIISVFLGEHLSEVLDSIEQNRPLKSHGEPKLTSIKVGGTVLDVKVNTLPEIARDLTDRNRTSPFAFTGNKFEFRAVGAKQSPSFPVALLNAAVASSLKEITAAIEAKAGGKRDPTKDEVYAVLKEYIVKTKKIRFEGDGYSAEWHAEAAKVMQRLLGY